ncbi:class I mannose-6-phosphate isomerase [Deinococcus sp. HMF7620]|uniref:Phosphohexomutase n=1 Tax=Deinococcus arboris TaxID=2682977 RepID=A0A7C9LQ12_9DEIO|nr:type I phosphomannose isomerase catalytic subunit [Deinococcus arboris]MVN86341.1 class I mannose-6-phosphate isomerase [Deinococcus arboris]
MAALPAFLPLTPRFHPRVWGGTRLAPVSPDGTPIGEAWLADGQSVVASGPQAGQTVQALMTAEPHALLGQPNARGTFPLLIKLLDCQDWLSVQVHPNDDEAHALVSPGERGKTEAWHVLEVEKEGALLAGVTAGTTPEALAEAIQEGHVLTYCERHHPAPGDTLLIPAGTLHALGPGLLIYEVQQASDTTYRVYDWDRPASAGRTLHLEESVRVTKPEAQAQWTPASTSAGVGELTACEFFTLRGVTGDSTLTLGGRCALVTAVEGEVTLTAGTETLTLTSYDTALIPAATGDVQVTGRGRVLVAQEGPQD